MGGKYLVNLIKRRRSLDLSGKVIREMIGQRLELDSVEELRDTINRLGAKNTDMMATRGVYRNVLVKMSPELTPGCSSGTTMTWALKWQ